MKRKISILLVLAMLLSLCTVGAYAETVSGSGFYVESGAKLGTSLLTVLAKDASGNTVSGIGANVDTTNDSPEKTFETFYAGAKTLDVSFKAPAAGQYLILLTSGTALPTESSAIYYIDQTAAANQNVSVSFTVKPMDIPSGTDLKLWVTSDVTDTESCALAYVEGTDFEKQPYVLGDVNSDKAVDAKDALKVLRAAAKLEDLSEGQKLAANVNGDSDIDAKDALKILRFAAKLITEW